MRLRRLGKVAECQWVCCATNGFGRELVTHVLPLILLPHALLVVLVFGVFLGLWLEREGLFPGNFDISSRVRRLTTGGDAMCVEGQGDFRGRFKVAGR